MTIDGGRVHGSDRLINAVHMQEIAAWESDRRIDQAARLPGIVDEKLLVAFTLRIAVIGAFGDDVNLFPIVQADIIDKQSLRYRIPIQAVRISQAVGIDFTASADYRHEGIGIRASRWNPVTSIRAELIFRMQINIGSDPQDFAHEVIELLREGMSGPWRFSLGAVAHRNVEVSVVILPGLNKRV